MTPDAPTVTPPAHVRTVTVEQVDSRVTGIEERESENYMLHRDLRSLVEANHLALVHQVGELARFIVELAKRLP